MERNGFFEKGKSHLLSAPYASQLVESNINWTYNGSFAMDYRIIICMYAKSSTLHLFYF